MEDIMIFSNKGGYLVKTVTYSDHNGFFHRKAIITDSHGVYIRDFSGYIDTGFIGKKFAI